ncbi:phage recombination protein Bet [Azospirillum sp. OGB3]|uniref:phage recombination protein Bet n=1 Tax=Azospirillum sp. OGB3 TaxID=2587012 RepID=UPI001605DBFA|nr:phage recombination protein Bet [Azospirillum sp. OGB3]MBB3268327.1 phage recombination protein Bet [Azospirillum sp. OGB3]
MGEVISLQPRIAYPAEAKNYGVNEATWRVLVESTFPSAKSAEGILLAVAYCQARKLDIMKRPVSIVPMWSSALNRYVETVWPGINELQTTAARTGEFAGIDAPIYGTEMTETFTGLVKDKTETVTLKFPEWCEVTVYRLVGGVRCPFTARIYWMETYSRKGSRSVLPTEMWVKRPKGQLAKCAKADALRAAFPEECGGYSAEEMDGKVIEADEADISRRRKQEASQSASVTDIDPETGEVLDGKPVTDEKPDLSQVGADVKELVGKLVRRALPNGAWETAIGYATEKLQGNDLVYAKYALRQAERSEAVPATVRSNTMELIQRAGVAGAWRGAKEYLSKLHKDGKLNGLEFEYAQTALELAEAEAAATAAAMQEAV